MPLTARMSLWGLYQYDSTILDGLTVPTGMDGDNVKQNLLLETAGLSILYPDPDFLKAAITVWSAERQDVWDKMYATTVAQYNPMENYDRIEETDEQTGGISVKNDTQTTDEQTSGISVTENTHSMDASSSDESTNVSTRNGNNESVSSNTAYNSNDFADTAKAVSSGQDNASNSGRSNGSTSENGTDKGNESRNDNRTVRSTIQGNESRNDNRTIRSRIHGNIGVRSGQELIMQSREVDVFCMTEFIINDFIQRFCVMVY